MPVPPLYVLNPAGFAAFERSVMIEQALKATGGRIEERAVTLSPVRTGRYVASWYSEVTRDGDGIPHVRVGNRAPYARYLEFGTRYMQRQRILGRAIDAATLA